MSAAEAARLIENGDHIYIQGSTSIPEVLVDAIADRGHELRDNSIQCVCRRSETIAYMPPRVQRCILC